MARIRLLAFALSSLALLSSCATGLGGVYGISAAPKAAQAERRLIAVPATLKVLQSQSVTKSYSASIEISAAKGEAESAQLIFYAGAADESGLSFEATDLIGPGGAAMKPELGIVGYVPLKHPTIVGFHRKGDYPDPIIPASEFSVRAAQGQSLWYTVRAPRDAAAGVYEGSASVVAADGSRLSLPVRVAVRNVTLPKTSFLKTSINFRKENPSAPEYYGEAWTDELEAGLPFLGLEYRFTYRVNLPLLETFSRGPEGILSADWTAFDERAAYWLDQGITCFELKLPISFPVTPDQIRANWGPRLAAIDEHLVEKGWTELFYFYFYDEPFRGDMPAMAARLDAIREFAPHVPNVLTYGITTSGQKKLAGKIGIWVPNMHQFDPKFAKARQAEGEQVWAYACVGNVVFTYPDNFRIDWYGAEHRALGWWLYKNGIQGYLYWAVDLWRRNPWKTTETFDWTNGDGVLFYPALDKKSLPYPSIRAHLMRDAFEDYDLLSLLRLAYGGGDDAPAEVRDLLAAKEVFPRPNEFTKDDSVYIRCHDRILELLEAAPAPAGK